MIVLRNKLFIQKYFSNKWNGNDKPKKNSQKRELGKDKWYNQMGQVGTSWSTWDKWDKEKGVFRSSWDKWDKDKGFYPYEPFHLSQMELQDRVLF